MNQAQAIALTGPIHAVALAAVVVKFTEFTQLGFKALEVDGFNDVTVIIFRFGKCAWEQLFEFLLALRGDIEGVTVHFCISHEESLRLNFLRLFLLLFFRLDGGENR
ncbi:hypothetical protein [Zhongshania aliphaticivorans]|uniref:hypothetical protein n=1 Tax=Zhongshania aliphaticivorans TaxID=1470434 RepID=UPI00133036C3|nr:hypothetical protein [Zhongshania aliphaticivorans]